MIIPQKHFFLKKKTKEISSNGETICGRVLLSSVSLSLFNLACKSEAFFSWETECDLGFPFFFSFLFFSFGWQHTRELFCFFFGHNQKLRKRGEFNLIEDFLRLKLFPKNF